MNGIIHTRQNIFDGTWQKNAVDGVDVCSVDRIPGVAGAVATIEPLDQHLDHYRRMLESNLRWASRPATAGRACMTANGPGLLCIPEGGWFKKYRGIFWRAM